MKYIDFMKEIAKNAGNIQTDYIGKISHISFKDVKGKNDIVTEVDNKCEELIVSNIRSEFPEHDILAEEGGYISHKDSDFKWIIDPLDGTMNYTHTYPYYCISIALEYKGEVIEGVVYDPSRDEAFSAVKGEGARLNGLDIKVSNSHMLEKSLVVSGTLYYQNEKLRRRSRQILTRIADVARGVRRDGSAALDLCYVAAGRSDGFWEFGLNPWDVAAGVLMVREAGGLVTDFSSGTYDIYCKEHLATNSRIHEQLLSLIY